MRLQLGGHVDVRVDEHAPGRVRSVVAAALHEWGVTDPAAVEDALVVVSELIGNAVRYGGRLVSVELDRRPGGVLISVLDSSAALPLPRDANDDDETGRGLRLVSAFSSSWGAEPRTGGKRVWALVSLPV